VQSNHIRTAAIDPNGAVSGTLTNGHGYSSQIPTALQNPQLAGLLRAHHVAITGVGAPGGIGPFLFSVLPFLLLIGALMLLGRRGLRQGPGGIMGIGASKAKLYEEERPSVGFADVAGYDAA
jgi:cell division protease FtsH